MRTKTANDALRGAREALNIGQAELAEAINRMGARAGADLRCDVRHVAKWESGEIEWPQARYRRAIEAVTGMSCAALGFRPPARRSAWPASDETVPQARHDVLLAAAALAGGTAVDPFADADVDPGHSAFVEDVDCTLYQLRRLEQKFGSDSLLPLIERQVDEVVAMLRAGNDTTGMKSVAARAHELAGWMHFDAGHHDRARELYKEALFLAQTAGDRGLVAYITSLMSMQSAQLGLGREAVQLARLGTENVRGAGPALSLLAVREAQGWAKLGAEREAFAALRRADHAFAGVGPRPGWVSFFTEGELDAGAAQVNGELGHWDKAEVCARRAVADPAMPMRARASFSVYLVTTRAHARDADGVAAATADVLPMLPSISSNRVRGRVRTLLEALPPGGQFEDCRQAIGVHA